MEFDDFVVRFSSERTAVKMKASFAYDTLFDLCPRSFQSASLPKNYFAVRATTIYQQATTYPELDALRIALMYAYQVCVSKQAELIEPHQLFPFYRELPVINANNPAWALQNLLHDAIDKSLAQLNRFSSDVQQVTLNLALTRRLGISRSDTVLSLFDIKAHILTDANRVVIEMSGGDYYILDAIALSLWRKLETFPRLSQKQYQQKYEEWLKYQSRYYFELLKYRPSLSNVVSAITFSSEILASQHLGDSATPLSLAKFVQALTGKSMSCGEKLEKTKKTRTRKSVTAFQQITNKLNAPVNRLFSLNLTVGSDDRELIDSVRAAVTTFEKNDSRQSRRSRAFSLMKETLAALLSRAYCNEQVSHTAWFISVYCADLAISGSPHKSKLRASTVKTSLSRLVSLAKSAWIDESLMSDAQHADLATIELTSRLADALSDLPADSQQSTAINFLYYLQQVSAVCFFDAEELEYSGAYAPTTRAHYVNPFDFDVACQNFNEVQSNECEQFLLFATLCYRLGLRHREARELFVDDIRFDCGDVVVSRYLLKKTQRAVRRVRLSFLTVAEQVQLKSYVAFRQTRQLERLFDESVLNALYDKFINTLRDVTADDDIVIHSLRHSAANNMLFQLSLCCKSMLESCRKRYYFLQHEIFDEQQLELIKADINQAGRRPDIFFPVLDTLAYAMGHVSPAVTMHSYLHMFDVLAFELSAMRHKSLSPKVLTQLVPKNNYRFEHKKQYSSCFERGVEAANDYIFNHFTRAFSATTHEIKSKPVQSNRQSNKIAFSDYLLTLQRYYDEPQSSFSDEYLKLHFNRVAGGFCLDFYRNMKSRDLSVYLTLFERLTQLTANTVNRRALKTLSEKHAVNSITRYRVLRRCLKAFENLGLNNLLFVITAINKEKIDNNWLALLNKSGHRFEIKEDATIPHQYLQLRPRGLRYAPWPHLPEILAIYETYLDFLERGNTDDGD